VITAVHTLVYSDDPPATRAFFRDVLQWPFVGDEGSSAENEDWLIFRSGPSELGVHPTSGEGWSTSRHSELSLMCDDIEATVAELKERGAVVEGEPVDRGFGIAVSIQVPGAASMLLYQPQHPVAYRL